MSEFGGEDVDRLRIALARIARLVDRQVSGDGMTRTQLSVLGTIARHGPLGIGELADLEGLNPTMLSRVLGKLEADGLVVRSAAADDRRAVRVQTTPAGRSLQQRLRRQRSQLLAARLTGLPAKQASQLLAALPALETLAEQLNRPQPAKSQQAKAQAPKPQLAKSQPQPAKPQLAKAGR
jgi:DNA-binding MarR family transcriptional regulator